MFKNINKEHIIKALITIDNNGVPNNRKSKKYFLVFKGKDYPPKYVIFLAYLFANNKMLPSESLSNEIGINHYLNNLGFEIKEKEQINQTNCNAPQCQDTIF